MGNGFKNLGVQLLKLLIFRSSLKFKTKGETILEAKAKKKSSR